MAVLLPKQMGIAKFRLVWGLSFPSLSESEAKLRSAVGKVPQGAW